MKDFVRIFDHTCLRPDATSEDIKKLCKEAKEYGFYSVCVNGCYVSLAKKELSGSDVKITAVIGFPLGAMSTECKTFEATDCCSSGANEIDMVMNIGALKEKRYAYVLDDIASVVAAADEYDAIVKVIIETGLLNDAEITKACQIAVSAGAEFVKTSTGFGNGGAKEEHIRLMRKAVGNHAGIKAAGGIKDYATCMRMVEAGADRIGASSTINIIHDAKAK